MAKKTAPTKIPDADFNEPATAYREFNWLSSNHLGCSPSIITDGNNPNMRAQRSLLHEGGSWQHRHAEDQRHELARPHLFVNRDQHFANRAASGKSTQSASNDGLQVRSGSTEKHCKNKFSAVPPIADIPAGGRARRRRDGPIPYPLITRIRITGRLVSQCRLH
jgi:hypothetical protein